MERSLLQMNTCLSLSEEMETELGRFVQRFETSASSSFTSSEYRAVVVRRFREGFQKGTSQRQLAAKAQQRWQEETTALYEFALRSADWIEVRNDEVIIADDSILAQFNRMLEAANEAQAELIEVQTRMQAAGQAGIEKLNQMLK